MFKRRFSAHILLFLTVILLTIFHIHCKKDPKITLEKAVDLAFTYRHDLEGFEYIVKSNWYSERAALGGFLPQFSIIADSGTSSRAGISGIGQLPVESVALNFSQLLFSYDGPLFQYKIAQEETNISKTQKDQLENSIRFNSENSFLQLKKILLKKQQIKSLDESSVLTFDQEETRQQVGFLNKTQWKSAKEKYSQGQTSVENYPNDINIEVSRLQRETDTQIDAKSISLDYENIEKIELYPVDFYYKKAIYNRPDLSEKRHQIKQAEYSNRFYKYRYIPEIYFGAQMQKSKMVQCPRLPESSTARALILNEYVDVEIPSVPFNNKPLTWHIGLQLIWNFDGLSSFNTSKKFDNLATNFMLQKKDLELDIQAEIEVIYNQLVTILNLLEPVKKRYQTAKTKLDEVKTQYDVGLSALFELKEAKLNYKNAEFDLISIKIDIRNNYQKLLFLCGYPPEIS